MSAAMESAHKMGGAAVRTCDLGLINLRRLKPQHHDDGATPVVTAETLLLTRGRAAFPKPPAPAQRGLLPRGRITCSPGIWGII